MTLSKVQGAFVFCEKIWNGNLQFCPKWLSEGLKLKKNHAGSNGMLRMNPSTLWIGCFHKKTVFWPVFEGIPSVFHTFIDVFLQKKVLFWLLCINSESAIQIGLKFSLILDLGKSFRSKIGGFKIFFWLAKLLYSSIKSDGFSLFYQCFSSKKDHCASIWDRHLIQLEISFTFRHFNSYLVQNWRFKDVF